MTNKNVQMEFKRRSRCKLGVFIAALLCFVIVLTHHLNPSKPVLAAASSTFYRNPHTITAAGASRQGKHEIIEGRHEISEGQHEIIENTNASSDKEADKKDQPTLSRHISASLDIEKLKTHKLNKWIVVTTIAPPTNDVIFLAKLEGWRMVVVGDTKTPQGWSHPNVDYLDIAAQESLGFTTAKVTPHHSYTRKNIGYLYAIARGAEVIYDTDDDNRPMDRLETFCLSGACPGLMFGGPKMFNAYKHFGQPTLWPRGFPLGEVATRQPTEYSLMETGTSSMIQQGLVNGDLDMDAIFRLTRKNPLVPLEVTFDQAAPPVALPEGVFSPLNSQNTLFHRDAFWALMLPSTTSFRISDIWRGYWAQRLLWEIGGHIAFFAPTAHHARMTDSKDEKDMYFQTDQLISFLRTWTCPGNFSFFDCVKTLSRAMSDKQFWGETDAHLTVSWLNDLSKLGYKEPNRVDIPALSGKLSKTDLDALTRTPVSIDIQRAVTLKGGSYVNFLPVEQLAPSIKNKAVEVNHKSDILAEVKTLCSNVTITMDSKQETYLNLKTSVRDIVHSDFTHTFRETLLIINSNYGTWLPEAVPYLEIMHRSIFPNIVYCANDPNKLDKWKQGGLFKKSPGLFEKISFIHADTWGPKGPPGALAYRCFTKAVAMNFNVTGYLNINDDTLIKSWNMMDLDKTKIWKNYITFGKLNCKQNVGWGWWTIGNRVRYNAMVQELVAGINKGGLDPHVKSIVENIDFNQCDAEHSLSDVYYVPKRFSKGAAGLFNIMYKHTLMLEIAIPVVTRWIGGEKDIVTMNATSIAMTPDAREREKKDMTVWNSWLGDESTKYQFFHPVKFSDKAHRRYVCENFMTELLRRT